MKRFYDCLRAPLSLCGTRAWAFHGRRAVKWRRALRSGSSLQESAPHQKKHQQTAGTCAGGAAELRVPRETTRAAPLALLLAGLNAAQASSLSRTRCVLYLKALEHRVKDAVPLQTGMPWVLRTALKFPEQSRIWRAGWVSEQDVTTNRPLHTKARTKRPPLKAGRRLLGLPRRRRPMKLAAAFLILEQELAHTRARHSDKQGALGFLNTARGHVRTTVMC